MHFDASISQLACHFSHILTHNTLLDLIGFDMVLSINVWSLRANMVFCYRLLKLFGYNTGGFTTTILMQQPLCHNDLHVVGLYVNVWSHGCIE